MIGALGGVAAAVFDGVLAILLLNLLIALLGSSFAKTSSEATLQGRVAFATVVQRLELVARRLRQLPAQRLRGAIGLSRRRSRR